MRGERKREFNTTRIVSVSAIGNHVPLMSIFPKFYFKNNMSTGASTASNGGAKLTGWSRERLFVDCMEHCMTCDRSSNEDTVL